MLCWLLLVGVNLFFCDFSGKVVIVEVLVNLGWIGCWIDDLCAGVLFWVVYVICFGEVLVLGYDMMF